uniref:Biogenesis of lysosome-related organelles complex 1 subunit 2-like n=1 Tax=Phallusia mammillata TaxID=59560 RepID=A0A6F9D6X2_9ASCI|nr:biogenesis of lysosome-related organelles complex 1 subunit 2-like [Phallusia mammillata]
MEKNELLEENSPNANEETTDVNKPASDNKTTSASTSGNKINDEIQENIESKNLTQQSETCSLYAEAQPDVDQNTTGLSPENIDEKQLTNQSDESINLDKKKSEMSIKDELSTEASSLKKIKEPLETELLTETENVSHDRSNKEKGTVDAEDQHLQILCSNMFQKMTLYLHGEVESTVEDYSLLERMNKVTTEKYGGMLQTAKQVGDSLRLINQKFVNLRPYLEQIEQIEQTVLSLEQAAYKLDAYTKKLEEKFRRIDRK